ncbi:MAG: hypothetical protein IKJ94_05500 [Oscillospiraceae bacterium]|nr:hypothetical protein [Oscillospiraceae bacterium]
MNDLIVKAQQLSKDFITNETEYMLGFVEAEQSNPLTRSLSADYIADTKKGISTLIAADRAITAVFEQTIRNAHFDTFCDGVYNCLLSKGKIVVSGCGATGRLAMRVEASWRKRMQGTAYESSVISLMTGGDYALIRAVESFEDYIQLGRMQARELSLKKNDLLIGVTATGETTSILGTAVQALEDGADVYMVVCTRPESVLGKLQRVDDVYTHKNCRSLYIPCGGMAVTGSTRMQSSSLEQALILSALELSIKRLLGQAEDKEKLIAGMVSAVNAVEKSTASLTANTDKEYQLYKHNGHVTYFADEYLLDVLADTTERGPTFAMPPFRPNKRGDLPLSWAFVKNPFCATADAWQRCFARIPRCVEKTEREYLALGIKPEDIQKIPDISKKALYEFEIGCEADEEREQGESLAMWISDDDAPKEFEALAKNYKATSSLLLQKGDIVETELEIFSHLAMKMVLNILSTGVMAKMGKIYGNYMISLKTTNKKLVDRATRIISDLCSVDYERANYELFLTKLMLEKDGKTESEVKVTIDRLLKKA